jgi:hypothetical protein
MATSTLQETRVKLLDTVQVLHDHLTATHIPEGKK